MQQWKSVGVVCEGQKIRVDGLNLWSHDWQRVDSPSISLPHPSYPNQLHAMNIYEIVVGDKRVRFATGELSANVWGFYSEID
ncbi:MAG: hypothetical protein AB8C95_13000 [Phycisphaeraceae bacterium]